VFIELIKLLIVLINKQKGESKIMEKEEARDFLNLLLKSGKLGTDKSKTSRFLRDLAEKVESEWEEEKSEEAALVPPPEIVGISYIIEKLKVTTDNYATIDDPILIIGEKGSGKRNFANYIHYKSDRKKQPFIELICEDYSQSDLEIELFGVGTSDKKGFGKKGVLEFVKGGTLFLSHANQVNPAVLKKLGDTLKDKVFTHVDNSEEISFNGRIFFAYETGKNEKTQGDEFMKNYFSRVGYRSLFIDPLRERREDIPYLVDYFVSEYCNKRNIQRPRIYFDAIEKLSGYDWDANILELKNTVEKNLVLSDESLEMEVLPDSASKKVALSHFQKGKTLFKVVQEYETGIIREVLKKFDWNKSKAAAFLGLTNESTLRAKMKRMGIPNRE